MSAQDPRVVDRDGPEPDIAASAYGGGGGGRGTDGRLSALETRIEYLATKEDIQKLKVWALAGVLGAVIAIVTVAIPLVFTLFP